MAVGVFMEFPGVTREQYEQLEQGLGLSGPPEGELIHVCGPTSDGGWRMVDVWESQEAFERFANDLLIPQAQALGFPQPSKREFFEPFHVLTSWPSSNPLCLCYPLGAAVASIHRAAESLLFSEIHTLGYENGKLLVAPI